LLQRGEVDAWIRLRHTEFLLDENAVEKRGEMVTLDFAALVGGIPVGKQAQVLLTRSQRL
jgi:hypothetical protein